MTIYIPLRWRFRDFLIVRKREAEADSLQFSPAGRTLSPECRFFSGVAVVGDELICDMEGANRALQRGALLPMDMRGATGAFHLVIDLGGSLYVHNDPFRNGNNLDL